MYLISFAEDNNHPYAFICMYSLTSQNDLLLCSVNCDNDINMVVITIHSKMKFYLFYWDLSIGFLIIKIAVFFLLNCI
jgi:hypothetical protein